MCYTCILRNCRENQIERKSMENKGNQKHKSEVHLIRHGITEGTAKKWLYGAMDIPLSNEGVDELARLAKVGTYPCQNILNSETGELMSREEIESADLYGENPAPDFYTSGMKRAEQTFFIIYGAVKHKVIDKLRELNFGIFEGHSHKELKGTPLYEEWLDKAGLDTAPPQGESPRQFSQRVLEGFKELLGYHQIKELSHRHSKIPAQSVLVCHGGVIAAIMNEYFGVRNETFYYWVPDPGHGYTLVLENGEIKEYREF